LIKIGTKTEELLKKIYINNFMDELMKELHVWREDEQIHHHGKPHIPGKNDCSWRNSSTLE